MIPSLPCTRRRRHLPHRPLWRCSSLVAISPGPLRVVPGCFPPSPPSFFCPVHTSSTHARRQNSEPCLHLAAHTGSLRVGDSVRLLYRFAAPAAGSPAPERVKRDSNKAQWNLSHEGAGESQFSTTSRVWSCMHPLTHHSHPCPFFPLEILLTFHCFLLFQPFFLSFVHLSRCVCVPSPRLCVCHCDCGCDCDCDWLTMATAVHLQWCRWRCPHHCSRWCGTREFPGGFSSALWAPRSQWAS